MHHVEPDQLALLALGEPVDPGQPDPTAHLSECPACRRELRSLQETVELARETVPHRDEDAALRPPEEVWHGIAAELGLHGARDRPDVVRDASAADDLGWFEPRPGGPRPAAGSRGPGGDKPGAGAGPDWRGRYRAGVESDGPGEPVASRWPGSEPARIRRQGRWAKTAVALVAAAAVGVLGSLGVTRPWVGETGRPPAASSTASLRPVSGSPTGVTGRAEVVEGGGGRQLRITTSGLPRQPGFYQIWVFDGRDRMQAVGALGRDSSATVPLPTTLDLDVFNVVDISLEPYDGDQTHSETSVLRGTLTT